MVRVVRLVSTVMMSKRLRDGASMGGRRCGRADLGLLLVAGSCRRRSWTCGARGPGPFVARVMMLPTAGAGATTASAALDLREVQYGYRVVVLVVARTPRQTDRGTLSALRDLAQSLYLQLIRRFKQRLQHIGIFFINHLDFMGFFNAALDFSFEKMNGPMKIEEIKTTEASTSSVASSDSPS